MKERRQKVRINESLSVSYQVVKSFRMVTSRSQDISEIGIRLPILQHLQPEVKLDMEISLDDSKESIKAIGEVIWSKKSEDLRFPFVAGIRFLKLDSDSLERLRAFIKQRAPLGQVELIEKSQGDGHE